MASKVQRVFVRTASRIPTLNTPHKKSNSACTEISMPSLLIVQPPCTATPGQGRLLTFTKTTHSSSQIDAADP